MVSPSIGLLEAEHSISLRTQGLTLGLRNEPVSWVAASGW